MMVLKRSKSIHRNRYSNDEELNTHRHKNSSSQSSALRSSLDTFIIPRRTRYPSGKSPHPESIDLQIAKTLLGYDDTTAQTSETKLQFCQGQKRTENPAQNDHSLLGAWMSSDISFDGASKCQSSPRYSSVNTALTGSDWSGFSIRHFCTSSYGSDRETSKFSRQYNEHAKEYGLTDLVAIAENEHKTQEEQSGAPTGAKQWLLNKLGRASPSKNLKDQSEHRLSRTSSIASLLRQRYTVTIGSQSLEASYRLGGTSILHLPPAYRAVHLAIPTCLAATANYLADNARGTPGIFRIPGQTRFVDALYNHYVTQFHNAQNLSGMVQAHIGSTSLPTQFSCSIHDVACAFKRFLRDVPGGILGSIALFKAFREIAALPPSLRNDRKIPHSASKGKLVALAILSLRSSYRLSLISAVFGLLAWMKQDNGGYIGVGDQAPILGPESMSSKALGLCFAPLLLGDLTEKIEFEFEFCLADRARPRNAIETSKCHLLGYGKFPKQIKRDERSSDQAASTAKARMHAAAAVVEMLVREWEEVVLQVHDIEGKSKLQRSRSSTRNVHSSSHHHQREDFARKAYGQSSKRSAAVSGTESLSRSVSTSMLETLKISPQNPSNTFQRKTVGRSKSPGVVPPVNESLGFRHVVRNRWSSPAFTRSATVLENSNTCRWPSLWTARDTYLVDATSSTRESLAWWERMSERSLKAGTAPERLSTLTANLVKNEYQGITNAGTTISAVLEEPNYTTSAPTQAAKPSSVGSAEPLDLIGSQTEPNMGTMDSYCALQPDIGDGIPSMLEKQPEPDNETQERGSFTIVAAPTEPSSNTCSPASTTICSGKFDYGNVDSGPQSGEALLTPKDCGVVKIVTQKIEVVSPYKQSPTMIPIPISEIGQKRRATSSTAVIPLPYLPRESFSMNSSNQWYSSYSPAKLRSTNELAHICATGEQAPSALAATRPPSLSNRAELTHFVRDAVPARPPAYLPLLEEPPIVRRVVYKASRENVNSRSSRNTSNNSEDFWQQNSHAHKVNVGTLYTENRRLKALLDSKSEETVKLMQRLDALRHFRDSGTLSEKLRELERECRLWKHRARWAEKTLTGYGLETPCQVELESP